MHGSYAIPEFYYLIWSFNLILKLRLYCKEIMPLLLFFFVFDPVFLLLCYLFLLNSWTIIFVQNSSRRRRRISGNLNCWLWIAYLIRYCVKDVIKNIFIKHFVGGWNTLTFYNPFVTSIQYVYIELFYIESYICRTLSLYKISLNPIKWIKTIITIFSIFLYSWYKLLYYTTYIVINFKKCN